MATKKTKQAKPTYNQLIRERKKDHEDIIAKAARITGLEVELKELKSSYNQLGASRDNYKKNYSEAQTALNNLRVVRDQADEQIRMFESLVEQKNDRIKNLTTTLNCILIPSKEIDTKTIIPYWSDLPF